MPDNQSKNITQAGQEVNASEEKNPELFARAEAGLAALRGEELEVIETPEIESEVEEAVSPSGETVLENENLESNEAAVEVAPESEGGTSSPTLPAAHIRSLKAYGWADGEIAQAFKDNPSQFTETAMRLHNNRVQESTAWAAQGRQSTSEDVEQAIKPAANKSAITATGLKAIDIAALKAKYGEDAMVEEVAGPVNEAIAAINAVLPQITGAVQSIQATEAEKLNKQVDQFFGDKDMKAFETVYGKTSNDATEDQWGNRNKVLQIADAMIVGASKQGRSLTVQEAMELAHDHVASDFKDQMILQQVRSKVTKRKQSITLKPGKTGTSSTTTNDGPSKDATEREVRARAGLNKIFANA